MKACRSQFQGLDAGYERKRISPPEEGDRREERGGKKGSLDRFRFD